MSLTVQRACRFVLVAVLALSVLGTVGQPVQAQVIDEPVRDWQPVTDAAQAFVNAEGLDGAGLVVVHKDEGVIYHNHFGSFTEDRISMIASSSKPLSAGVMMSLHEDGLLDLDVALSEQLGWPDAHPGAAPVHLVSNLSGLVPLQNIIYLPYLCQFSATSWTLSDCGEQILTSQADNNRVVPPGTEFRYGGGQWQVAGAAAEVASGKSWAQLIDEIYVQPCGLDATGFVNIRDVGGLIGYPTGFGGDPGLHAPHLNPNIEGGAYTTTGDYAKLLLMHLRGGVCENGTVFTPQGTQRLHTQRVSNAREGEGYAMGWWVDEQNGILNSSGAWGAYPWINLQSDYAAFWIIEDLNTTTARFKDELVLRVHTAVTGEDQISPIGVPGVLGDPNCDGYTFAVDDALHVVEYLVGRRVDAPCEFMDESSQLAVSAGDMTGDGVVNLIDALVLARCAAGSCPSD